jgi:toxin ParE1/3/4
VKRYIVSADARADLDEIWDYIVGRSSAETASTFFWRLYDSFASLAQSPSAGVAVPGLGKDSARKFPVGNYLIYYRPMRGKVMVWRVLHGKRVQLRALRGHPLRLRA